MFSRRKSDALISASGLVVVDIDHLASLEEAEQLRNHLFEDPYLGTRLAFVSPGGLGVKLFIPGDETVRWAMSYIQLLYADTFKGEVDTCGKDIARCCFLSHDSNAKIFIP
ncbi:BT4734/BF3469 family protein [Parabacteroides distasonis]|uniref:BT4734/BF3469 family protein n=1 Tax=uncultured Parabacteroides sp. TaxID=512312 RepID=UPI0022DE99A5|nr:BT4734/BF3469 family protein [Parabacteroides distasonis]